MIRFLSALLCCLMLSTPLAAATGRLPTGITPIHYDISIRPDAQAMSFSGSETIRVIVSKPSPTITLNVAELKVSSATINGVAAQSIKIDEAAQQLILTFASPISVGEHNLALNFSGKINSAASGLFAVDYQGADGKPARMLATQFEAPDARRFAPMWDEPAYKATFTLSAFTPAGQTAYSNMPVAKKDVVDGGAIYHFAQSPKMSSYLLFLGMGDVDRKTKMAGNVEVGIITRRGVVDQGDYALEAAVKQIEYYNDYFGTPYPLPKLDMIAAPGSSQFFGAMENWGAILYFERTVLVDPAIVTESQRQNVFATVGHEIAHQWFGNLVTMAWWDDLWLNEGFASWMESKNSGDLNPDWQVQAQSVAGGLQGAMNLDARSTTHPIVQKIETVDQISQAFDTITYQKGEAVIAMLEGTLGEVPFRDGVRRYMKKYAYQNTKTSQLWDELSATSGQNVARLMDGFTTQGGVPLIKVGTVQCIAGQTKMMLSQSRFGLDAGSKAPKTWIIPVSIGFAGKAGVAKKVLVSGGKATSVMIDGCGVPVVNFGHKAYARTLYSPADFAKLQSSFATLSLADQVGLMADSLALANGDYAMITQHLGLISSLSPDASPLVWSLAAGQIAGLDDRVKGTPNQVAFRAKAARILAPVLKKVGWIKQPGESTLTAQLRERLLPVVALLGDASVVAEAKRYLDLSFSDPKAVPGPVRLVALSAYSRAIDPAGWDALRARAKAEVSPVAKSLYYSALAASTDWTLVQKALDIAMSDEAPVPVRASIIAAASNEHPAMAFDWAVKRKDAINKLIDASSRSEFIVDLASGGDEVALANRVTAYANANLPADARAPARANVNIIMYRADRKTKLAPAIGRWARLK
jgi:aminopeptidase N